MPSKNAFSSGEKVGTLVMTGHAVFRRHVVVEKREGRGISPGPLRYPAGNGT